METETLRIQVATRMSNLPPNLGFTSAVIIKLHEVIEELLEDATGTTHVASYVASLSPISSVLLKPRSFLPEKLSRLLRRQLNRETPFCEFLAEKISFCRFSRANYTLYQRPFLMSVNVRVVKEVRFVLSSVSAPLSCAPVDVFQRLLEEQTVEPARDLDESCSICFEKLSESSSESHHKSIIQMPKCLHSFHQNCIFEWLARHNSCPLCRRVPFEEDQD